MGKVRRQRHKYHLASNKTDNSENSNTKYSINDLPPMVTKVNDNIFAGIDISIDNLRKDLSDDTRSIKSFKSLKSELGNDKQLSKKDKRSLKHQLILNKIDVVQQARKANTKKNKNKKPVEKIFGLHDSLPALKSLIHTDDNKQNPVKLKKKAVEKVKKRHKDMVQNTTFLKKMMMNPEFRNNPMAAIKQRIENFVNEK